MADELIDICDEENNLTGVQKMKSEAHRDGLWHRNAHIWIYNSKGEILLQLRAKEKLLFPDVWDISAAGHVGLGEDPIISGLREMVEEVGLKIKQEDLHFLEIRKTRIVYKDIKNNEFYYVYLFKFDGDIGGLKLQNEEVQEIKFFSVEEIEEGLKINPEKFVPHGDYWFKIINEVKMLTANQASMSQVLETTKSAFEKSKYVKINHDKITELAKTFQHGNVPHWLTNSPLSFSHLTDEEKLNFLLVFNSTSFCYWSEPKWTIEYKGEKYDGSWAMIACILRALENGKPILDAKYRSTISRQEYSEILSGNVEIPLFDQRLKITRDVAIRLLEKYDGSFANLIKQADGDAMKLLDLIVQNFSAFDDTSIYYKQVIYFYKRAQLLVADIYQLFGGEGYGNLKNVDQLTACADYKLPQSLRTLGIISYTKSLEEKIDNKIPLIHCEQEEVDIRVNTIWAVEFIRQELEKLDKHVLSIGINDHLWLMGQDKSKHDKPYHRTETTAY